MSIRINKYIQENLGISRRNVTTLIQSGTVFVNQEKVESFSHILKLGDILEIRSMKIKKKVGELKQDLDLIVFNKPIGFVCSKSDKHNKTIYELLPREFQNYFYIGRLDKDSRGLLLLTNNSTLVDKFQHPRNQVEKEYIVQIDRFFSVNDYKKMKKGILDDGDLLQIKTAKFYEEKRKYFVRLILLEGKKRHIRRMFDSLGYKIIDLQRTREGQFELGNLKEGNWSRVKKLSSS